MRIDELSDLLKGFSSPNLFRLRLRLDDPIEKFPPDRTIYERGCGSITIRLEARIPSPDDGKIDLYVGFRTMTLIADRRHLDWYIRSTIESMLFAQMLAHVRFGDEQIYKVDS